MNSDHFEIICNYVRLGKPIKQACLTFGRNYDYFRHNATSNQRRIVAEIKNKRTGKFKIKDYSKYQRTTRIDTFILNSY